MALPFAVVLIGCGKLLGTWSHHADLRRAAPQTLAAARPHVATLVVVVATLTPGAVLEIVALHSLTD